MSSSVGFCKYSADITFAAEVIFMEKLGQRNCSSDTACTFLAVGELDTNAALCAQWGKEWKAVEMRPSLPSSQHGWPQCPASEVKACVSSEILFPGWYFCLQKLVCSDLKKNPRTIFLNLLCSFNISEWHLKCRGFSSGKQILFWLAQETVL